MLENHAESSENAWNQEVLTKELTYIFLNFWGTQVKSYTSSENPELHRAG